MDSVDYFMFIFPILVFLACAGLLIHEYLKARQIKKSTKNSFKNTKTPRSKKRRR
ncbi:hypothetical protein DFOLPJBN_000146 [Candidatus Liberibacter asiaticus]|uniref:hypothetical protein n=1 Tax=Liberibacter africanus TaxID=34020 RepID=UPI00339D5B0C